MSKEWKYFKFEECLDKFPSYSKIPKNKFLTEGVYPIISQEKDFINGYWNEENDVIQISKPVVIFGDHTRVVKLIDFDFVAGADGLKIFQPINEIKAKYFAYFLKYVKLDNLGYARHYRLLKQESVPVPPLSEQQKIVEKLDAVFELTDRAKANIRQNILNAKELFQSKLNEVFENGKLKVENGDWERLFIEKVCDRIFAGGDAPKNNFSKEKTEEFKIPIYANAVAKNGLYGYTNIATVTTNALTIAARGSGTGFTCVRKENFVAIVRLLVLIPNKSIDINFLKLAIDNLVVKSSGAAIPQLTVPMLKKYEIILPTLETQQKIVSQLDQLSAQTELLVQKYEQKLQNLEELRKSVLEKAFMGELVSNSSN